MRIDGPFRLRKFAAWLVLVPVPGTVSCGGVTTESSARVNPPREGGAGRETDGARGTAGAQARSPVDCGTLSGAACLATPSCMPILASRYDAFSSCLNPPEAAACTKVDKTCGATVTPARSDTGECRVFTSTCLAPGWSPVEDPTSCASAIITNGPRCKRIFGPCHTDPCTVVIQKAESPADGGAAPASCRLVLPPAPQGHVIEISRANVYTLPASGPRPVPYVVDAAHCDPGSGGWYYTETDAGPTAMQLCPITCAVPRDTLQLSFGCPTLRADGLCMQ